MGTPPRTKLTKADASYSLKDAAEMIWHKTSIRIYPITDSQLEELVAGYNSLHLVFFGIFVGAAISLGIACRQSLGGSPDKPYYFAAAIATAGLAILFGVTGLSNYRKASRRKKTLYVTSVPIEK